MTGCFSVVYIYFKNAQNDEKLAWLSNSTEEVNAQEVLLTTRLMFTKYLGFEDLYDISTVTDERCTIVAIFYRVMTIQVDYSSRNGSYTQRLTLGKR